MFKKVMNVTVKVLVVVVMAAVFCLAYFGFMSLTGLPAPRLWQFCLLTCLLLGLTVGMVVASQVDIDF